MLRILMSNSSGVIGMAAKKKMGSMGWENPKRKINDSDYQYGRN
jgi:hypothetical protein